MSFPLLRKKHGVPITIEDPRVHYIRVLDNRTLCGMPVGFEGFRQWKLTDDPVNCWRCGTVWDKAHWKRRH